jgi:CubicO group peptidase (beta-lactamase class C family)
MRVRLRYGGPPARPSCCNDRQVSTDRIDAMLADRLGAVRADGVAVGVTSEKTTVFGAAGSVAGKPVDDQAVMYGASVAKQFIGLLMAQAIEAGHVTEDDQLIGSLPELPDWMAEIRLRHLLHHTSGLVDVTAPNRGVPASNADVLERLQRCRQPALDSPGRRFCYNNTGYVLLAEVVSRVFQRPIGPLAREQIFRPLAMTRTSLSAVAPTSTTEPTPPGTVGDGGLWTTVGDLIRYLNALNCDLHDPAVVHRAETPGCLDDGTPLDYAWGVRVNASPAGRRITHGGTWAGWLAKTVRLPERQIAVAVLSIGGKESAISELGTDLADHVAQRQ